MGYDAVRSIPPDFSGRPFLRIPAARGSSSTYLVGHLCTQVVSEFSGYWRLGLTRCVADLYRMVRHCAYRLAQLYAELGKTEACVRMLKWLEEEDDGFDVERG